MNENYYDKNDPDIIKLQEYATRVEDQGENYYEESSENRNIPEEQSDDYIKNANDENEELYSAFANLQQNAEEVKKPTRRVIQSARSNPNKRKEEEREEVIQPLAIPTQRPTTVPLDIVNEGLEGTTQKKYTHRKGLKSAKSIRGGGFAIVGRASKLTPRLAMKAKNSADQNAISSLMIVNANRQFPKLHNTVSSTKSFFTEEDPRRIGHQINLVTDPRYTDRPVTAATKTRPKEPQPAPRRQERPMSAYVSGNFMKKMTSYVPTNYMRPFTNHKRPISAAVNVQVGQGRGTVQVINPEITKKKYMKYLRDLEYEAQQFIIEEDNNLAEKTAPVVQGKKHKKTVKLKKK